MFDFHSDFYFQFFSRDQVGWGLVEFSKVLMIIIIMKPSRYPGAGTLPKGLFCKDVYRNNKFQNSKQKILKQYSNNYFIRIARTSSAI